MPEQQVRQIYMDAKDNAYKRIVREQQGEWNLQNIEKYISLAKMSSIVSPDILKKVSEQYYNRDNLVLYLWLRDLEDESYNHHNYNINNNGDMSYQIAPQEDLINLIHLIYKRMPKDLLNEDQCVDIILNVITKCMIDKYNEWFQTIDLFLNNHAVNDLLSRVPVWSLRQTSHIKTDILIIINLMSKDIDLYIDNFI